MGVKKNASGLAVCRQRWSVVGAYGRMAWLWGIGRNPLCGHWEAWPAPPEKWGGGCRWCGVKKGRSFSQKIPLPFLQGCRLELEEGRRQTPGGRTGITEERSSWNMRWEAQAEGWTWTHAPCQSSFYLSVFITFQGVRARLTIHRFKNTHTHHRIWTHPMIT